MKTKSRFLQDFLQCTGSPLSQLLAGLNRLRSWLFLPWIWYETFWRVVFPLFWRGVSSCVISLLKNSPGFLDTWLKKPWYNTPVPAPGNPSIRQLLDIQMDMNDFVHRANTNLDSLTASWWTNTSTIPNGSLHLTHGALSNGRLRAPSRGRHFHRAPTTPNRVMPVFDILWKGILPQVALTSRRHLRWAAFQP